MQLNKDQERMKVAYKVAEYDRVSSLLERYRLRGSRGIAADIAHIINDYDSIRAEIRDLRFDLEAAQKAAHKPKTPSRSPRKVTVVADAAVAASEEPFFEPAHIPAQKDLFQKPPVTGRIKWEIPRRIDSNDSPEGW